MEYVLILGGTSDIGQALATVYALNGYNLFLAAREPEKLERFAADLEIRNQVKVVLNEFDAVDFSAHQTFYESLNPQPAGTILCFGYLGTMPASSMAQQEILKTIEVNFTGCASILSIVANAYEKRRAGFIVGISSIAGERGRASNYVYGSTKAAVTAFLSGLRNRLHRSHVQVLTVKPGFVRTKMTKDLNLPAKVTATSEQVANHVFRAQQKRKEVIYSIRIWRFIMMIIRNIPEKIFKKLSL